MENWFALTNSTDRFFLICAFVGFLGVLLRLVSQFFGFAHGGLDGDVDFGDGSAHGDTHHDGDGFKVISFHGLAAFFMMFGLVGFAVNSGHDIAIPIPIALGVVAGAISVWLIAKLFKAAGKLQSVGNLDINKAVGCRGLVYMQIPKGASGRVVVNIDGRQREMDAIHAGGEAIETGTSVVVVKIDNSMAIVELS
jgi:membrane protein implicated in regulation of membrane protease activity